MGIVNPGTSVLYTDIPADVLEKIEDVVLNRRLDAAERLIELAESLKANMSETAGQPAVKQDAWREGTVQERLKYALMKGIGDFLEQDLAEALPLYDKAVEALPSTFSDSMIGCKIATAFFMVRAVFTTWGRNILPAPNSSPTWFIPSISGPSITSTALS